jgi:regulator of protease activity HflC (stomatin/prohibitin superfamily)
MLRAKAKADALMLEARAEADANEMRMRTLSTPLIQYELIKRWNGRLPNVAGGSVPFLDPESLMQPNR